MGLLNVQAFSGLEPSHIVLGEIVDPASGNTAVLEIFLLIHFGFREKFQGSHAADAKRCRAGCQGDTTV